jgi:hypothetical protein
MVQSEDKVLLTSSVIITSAPVRCFQHLGLAEKISGDVAGCKYI